MERLAEIDTRGSAGRGGPRGRPDGRQSNGGKRKAYPYILFLLLCLSIPAHAAFEAERALLNKGDYKAAISQLESILSKTPDQAEAMSALLDGLIATGEYQKAADFGDQFLQRKPDAGVAVRTAQARMLVGDYDRAEKLLTPLSTVRALWMRGTLRERVGDRDHASALFEQAVARASNAAGLALDDQVALAKAMIELRQVQEANQQYQFALKAAPQDTALATEWGELMAAKHNPGEAEGLFRQALDVNPQQTAALVGMADLAAENFDSKAEGLLRKALSVNPNLAEAHLGIVRMDLESEDYADAAKELQAVDRVNPQLLESWSLHAALEYVQGHTDAAEQQWIPKILEVNPSYGQVYAELADLLVMKRQYPPSVDFYRLALEKNPDLDDAHSSLGIQMFRLGQEDEARKVLEEAYRRDPYNVWTVNTLRLMDTFSNYDTFETDKFRVKLNKKESALLWPYVNQLLQESYASLTSRYGYSPTKKVLIELFPDHEDFAVRTLGLPGLGALGASFGPVVAMDSPSARPIGEFHWGSTLWHEFGHVITLGMTNNRVPRWFTEGLSVYEEGHAHPGWGDPMDLGLIQALQKHGLVPIEKLDSVFIHPEYPDEVIFAYFQAGMICDFIADKYGFPKILAMLHAYDQGQNDEAAIRAALGLSMPEFDAGFREYARVKTYNFGEAIRFNDEATSIKVVPESGEGGTLPQRSEPKAEGDFITLLRKAAQLKDAQQFDQAIASAEQAKKLFPPYVEEGNPYELLAGIYERQGQKDKAVAELMAWRLQRGRDPKVFKKLADLQEQTGHRKDAIETLMESLQVSMYDVDTHEKLGAWFLENGDAKSAVREYSAALDLDAPDKAEAHYQLASAYKKLSDTTDARKEIVQSLEIAPGYRPAQQLLLELTQPPGNSQ